MNIAMIFHSLNVAGGSVSAFLSLANELQNQGHHIDVYCYYYDPEHCFPELNKSLNVHYIERTDIKKQKTDNTSLLIRFSLGIEYYINARKIFSLMNGKTYDAILASEASAYIPGLIYKKKYKTPVFWSVFDPISLVDKERPGMIINKHKWFTYIIELHNLYDKRKIRQIDKVIVSSQKMKRRMDKFYGIDTYLLPLAGVRYSKKDQKKDFSSIIAQRLKEKFNYVKEKEKILLSIGHFFPP